MLPATPVSTCFRARFPRPKGCVAFSLMEVVFATGLCTYALLVIVSLLPVGLGSIQKANQQMTQTEIFNQIWSEVNTTPYGNISSYSRLMPGITYYDSNGTETNQASAVFTVVCSQPPMTLSTASGGSYATNELTAVKVQIGYHVDPTSVTATDGRVASRTFLVARRDGSTNSVPNGW